MKLIIKNLWLACFICLSVLVAKAATHYLVPTNTSAANPYTNWGMAATSIIDVVKAAMTNSSSLRIIWVTNGVYVLTNDATTITNDVVIRSVNGRDATIFNGNGLYRGFRLNHTNCVLDGLTITNGYSTGGGAGILMNSGIVTNCLITDCISDGAGISRAGGIRIYGPGAAMVANSIIRGNIEKSGDGSGGISLNDGSTSTIQNCIIERNQAGQNHGAGISIGYTAPLKATIRNCLIRYNSTATNSSRYGGGIFFSSYSTNNVLVANCTIVSNYAGETGGGICFIGSGIKSNIIFNCIISSNKGGNAGSSATYNIADINTPGGKYACAFSCSTSNANFVLDERGNTTNDPGFINFAGENYRFNRYSPCFNSGTNQDWMNSAVDLDGQTRIRHGRVDMGAYELFIPEGTMFRGR